MSAKNKKPFTKALLLLCLAQDNAAYAHALVPAAHSTLTPHAASASIVQRKDTATVGAPTDPFAAKKAYERYKVFYYYYVYYYRQYAPRVKKAQTCRRLAIAAAAHQLYATLPRPTGSIANRSFTSPASANSSGATTAAPTACLPDVQSEKEGQPELVDKSGTQITIDDSSAQTSSPVTEPKQVPPAPSEVIAEKETAQPKLPCAKSSAVAHSPSEEAQTKVEAPQVTPLPQAPQLVSKDKINAALNSESPDNAAPVPPSPNPRDLIAFNPVSPPIGGTPVPMRPAAPQSAGALTSIPSPPTPHAETVSVQPSTARIAPAVVPPPNQNSARPLVGSVTKKFKGKEADGLEQVAAAIQKGDYHAVKKLIEENTGGHPQSLRCVQYYYLACVQTADWNAALSSLDKLVELQPAEKVRLACDYGRLYFELHRYEESRKMLQQAMHHGVDSEPLHHTLLLLSIAQHDDETAENEYRKLIALKPRDLELQVELGELLWKRNKKEEALAIFDRVAQTFPQNAELQSKAGYAHLVQGHFKAAADRYRLATKATPSQKRYQDALRYAENKLAASGQ